MNSQRHRRRAGHDGANNANGNTTTATQNNNLERGNNHRGTAICCRIC